MANPSTYERLFAKFYDPFMDRLERAEVSRRRKRLLRDLTGSILEVGAGTGACFPWYSSGAAVLAVEPSAPMADHARERLEKIRAQHPGKPAASIEILQAGIGDAALDERIRERSLDAVVCTLVLCTVPDLDLALERFEKWLKPGGKLILLEHIRSHGPVAGAFQSALTPAWKIFAGGCRLNRPTDFAAKSRSFRVLSEQYFRLTMPFYEAVLEKT